VVGLNRVGLKRAGPNQARTGPGCAARLDIYSPCPAARANRAGILPLEKKLKQNGTPPHAEQGPKPNKYYLLTPFNNKRTFIISR
jgi:hypothetical protein